jgi:predicted dehydrogenase
VKIAVVGCGYISEFYLAGQARYSQLDFTGVFDLDAGRARDAALRHRIRAYGDMAELLADSGVECVAVLTNPGSHHDLIRMCLEAGKHVYTEKPLALRFEQAEELVDLAEARGLRLASAPCSLLGETAQTIWRALREQEIGRVRLVYAEVDAGMVHGMPYETWVNQAGTPWPYEDEFEVGVVLEHAGYSLTWLTAFFGPVDTVTAQTTCLVPDKPLPGPEAEPGPDFSVAYLTFESGVVARLTLGGYAMVDRSLTIFGDQGQIWTRDTWDYGSDVYVGHRRNPGQARGWQERIRSAPPAVLRRLNRVPRSMTEQYPLVRKPVGHDTYVASHQMDFPRGLVELARAVDEGGPCRLSARHALHITEISLALDRAAAESSTQRITSRFDPIEPMPWARR